MKMISFVIMMVLKVGVFMMVLIGWDYEVINTSYYEDDIICNYDGIESGSVYDGIESGSVYDGDCNNCFTSYVTCDDNPNNVTCNCDNCFTSYVTCNYWNFWWTYAHVTGTFDERMHM
jgi:hypothetical protein